MLKSSTQIRTFKLVLLPLLRLSFMSYKFCVCLFAHWHKINTLITIVSYQSWKPQSTVYFCCQHFKKYSLIRLFLICTSFFFKLWELKFLFLPGIHGCCSEIALLVWLIQLVYAEYRSSPWEQKQVNVGGVAAIY